MFCCCSIFFCLKIQSELDWSDSQSGVTVKIVTLQHCGHSVAFTFSIAVLLGNQVNPSNFTFSDNVYDYVYSNHHVNTMQFAIFQNSLHTVMNIGPKVV